MNLFGLSERDALQPLLDLARQKQGHELTEWLDDLRVDAPTVVARIEYMLSTEASSPIVTSSPDRPRAVSWLARLARLITVRQLPRPAA